ncbi:MAG TPA: long-chain-fatty-acid--CoA ligase [Mycobacteriales bacterium]|nr:long-chain-fatty-acid--CoA ligase [Mycobacteriales bacterium]
MAGIRLPLDGAHWVDHVGRHAFATPDEVAIRFMGDSITWAQLDARVHRVAAGLAARGVGKGDRIAILMTNRPEFVETTLGANAVGAIAVPLNFRLAPDEVAYILGHSGAKVVVTDSLLQPLASAAVSASEEPPLIVVSGLEGEGTDGTISYDALLGEASEAPDVEIDERDVSMIMYTSGTTGRPKGAMLTHLNLLMQSVTAIRTSRLAGENVVSLCNVPLFHIAGIGGMPSSLMIGARTVIMPTGLFDAESTLDIVESEKVSSLFLVPAQWQVMCAHPDATRRCASLRTIAWGAAPASVSLLEDMARVFPHTEIISVFGQTEMSPVTTSLPGVDAVRKIGSVGKVIPTIVARVVDDEMNDVKPGEVGEIVYRGPTLMAGYWNDPEATAEAYAGGWFHSGDLVRADDEGFLYVVDRKKDMIISGGENIYCAEVENVLAAHPGIADVAVIGIPHDKWGETPAAVVVAAQPDSPPTLDDIVDFTRDRLASYKKPTALIVVSELPRNASGKVLKHELRARHAKGELTAS